jgi:hypothetical protein
VGWWLRVGQLSPSTALLTSTPHSLRLIPHVSSSCTGSVPVPMCLCLCLCPCACAYRVSEAPPDAHEVEGQEHNGPNEEADGTEHEEVLHGVGIVVRKDHVAPGIGRRRGCCRCVVLEHLKLRMRHLLTRARLSDPLRRRSSSRAEADRSFPRSAGLDQEHTTAQLNARRSGCHSPPWHSAGCRTRRCTESLPVGIPAHGHAPGRLRAGRTHGAATGHAQLWCTSALTRPRACTSPVSCLSVSLLSPVTALPPEIGVEV